MSAPESAREPGPKSKIRRDGWTPERQLGFLAMLAESVNVGSAAASVGMSRESAYRLRSRRDGALFAALWDSIMLRDAVRTLESHDCALLDGRLARLLGTHYRRKRGDFSSIGSPPTDSART